MFEPGNKLGGRPKGVKNKATRDYMAFNEWFRKASEDHDKIRDPKERFLMTIQIIDRLMSKKSFPMTPEESKNNAIAREEVLLALEGKDGSPAQP